MKKKEIIQRKNKYVFADSSAFFALFHNGEKWHKEATKVYSKLKRENYTLVTTNLIVAETHQLILARLDSIKARDIIFTYSDKDFSLADAVSFVIMEEVLRTQIAFAFDHHFEQKSFCLAKDELL